MINVFGPRRRAAGAPEEQARPRLRRPAARQRRRPVRASSALETGQITPAQFVDLNAKIGGARRSTSSRQPRAHRGRPARRCATPTAAARSTRPTTSTRSRSSTCAAPTPAPSTTPTARGRSARGSSASTAHFAQPRHLVRPGAADRRPELHRPRACWRWTAGSPPSRRTAAREPLAEKIVDDRPAGPPATAARRSPASSRSTCPASAASASYEQVQTALRHAARRSPARASPPTPTSAR